ncbi:MAG: ATP-binding cassette domain-containing protein [Planctomycetota bacterium]
MIEATSYLQMDRISYQTPIISGALLLNNISLNIASGEFLAFTGDDLTGKTSLLKLCAGLLEPTGGCIRIRGKQLSGFSYRELQLFRQKIGFVLQNGVLINNLSLKENITLPLRYHSRLSDDSINRSAEKYLELLNLTGYANERPAELSLETRLLTGLARALIVEPELLLLDEIFSSLSRDNLWLVINHLKEIKAERRLTCLATTGLADLLSSFPEGQLIDRLVVIESGQVIEEGATQSVRMNLLKKQG